MSNVNVNTTFGKGVKITARNMKTGNGNIVTGKLPPAGFFNQLPKWDEKQKNRNVEVKTVFKDGVEIKAENHQDGNGDIISAEVSHGEDLTDYIKWSNKTRQSRDNVNVSTKYEGKVKINADDHLQGDGHIYDLK